MAIGQLGLRADYIATLQAIDPNQRIRCEGYVRAKRDRPTNGPANTRSASRYFFFRVYEELKGTCDAHSLVVEVYRAMASVGRSDRPRAKAGMRQRAVRGARSSDE
jgi:hypothetical protein